MGIGQKRYDTSASIRLGHMQNSTVKSLLQATNRVTHVGPLLGLGSTSVYYTCPHSMISVVLVFLP